MITKEMIEAAAPFHCYAKILGKACAVICDLCRGRAEAALTAALSVQWRGMESAPKDGTRIWLYFPNSLPDDRQVVGWWHDDDREPYWMDHADNKFDPPTHWIPLPPPPPPTQE